MSQNICGDFLVEISFKVFLGSPDPGTALETSDFYVLHYFNYPNLKKYICKHMYMYIKTEPLTFFYFFYCLNYFLGPDVETSVLLFYCQNFQKIKNNHRSQTHSPSTPPSWRHPGIVYFP